MSDAWGRYIDWRNSRVACGFYQPLSRVDIEADSYVKHGGGKLATTVPQVFVLVMCMTDQHCEVVQPVGNYTYNSFDECNQQLTLVGPEITQKNKAANREIAAGAGNLLPDVTSVSCRPQIADWFLKQMDKNLRH